jgi:hypothetical protein
MLVLPATNGYNLGTPEVGFMQSGGAFIHNGNSSGAKVGVQGFSQGTSGTNYGGYFRASNGSENYGIWVDGGKNYFRDNVGIGIARPEIYDRLTDDLVIYQPGHSTICSFLYSFNSTR